MNQQPKINMFFCYAREDQPILLKLLTHMAPLRRSNLVQMWSDIDIGAGVVWEEEIERRLDTAHIIILLVSPDFIDSNYCYSNEMTRALARHERGEARIIRIIIRPCHWRRAPFSKLQVLPKDAKPIKSWPDPDDAYLDVTEKIGEVVEELVAKELLKSDVGMLSSLPGGQMPKRPLHIIWIIDTSSTMAGDKIQSLNTAIRESIPELRSVAQQNPNAQIFMRAITFASGAKWHIAQPTPVEDVQWVDVVAGFGWYDAMADGRRRDIGAALRMVANVLKMPPMETRGLPPVLVLITNGSSTDNVDRGIQDLMDQLWGRKAVRIGIGIGNKAGYGMLENFIGNSEIKPLRADNAEQIVQYVKWASTMVSKTYYSKESL